MADSTERTRPQFSLAALGAWLVGLGVVLGLWRELVIGPLKTDLVYVLFAVGNLALTITLILSPVAYLKYSWRGVLRLAVVTVVVAGLFVSVIILQFE